MFKTKSILVHLRDTSIGKVCDHIQLGLFNESDTDFDNPKAQITNRKYWLNCVQAVVVSGRSLPYWMIQTLLAYSIIPFCPPPFHRLCYGRWKHFFKFEHCPNSAKCSRSWFQLDVEKHPRRPQYNLASEIPLNLFDCRYDEVDENGVQKVGDWIYDQNSLQLVN